MNRFPFVVVEGLDGTGKTTLRKGLFRLYQGLLGVTPLAVLTTNYLDAGAAPTLVDGKYQPSEDNADAYLAALAADKRTTTAALILPSLPVRPVIADRWVLSEMAFFAIKHDLPIQDTHRVLADAIPMIPDLTLVLDITSEAAMGRAAGRSGDATRPDWDVLDVQSRVRQIYRSVGGDSSAYPALGPVVVLDAARERAEVLHAAWRALEARGLLTQAQGGAR